MVKFRILMPVSNSELLAQAQNLQDTIAFI